jgi:hypothetical protein
MGLSSFVWSYQKIDKLKYEGVIYRLSDIYIDVLLKVFDIKVNITQNQ